MDLKKILPIILISIIAAFILLSLKITGVSKKEFDQINKLELNSLITPNKVFALKEFSNDYYIVHILATWCEACKTNSPYLNLVKSKTNIKIVGFIIRDPDLNIHDYLKINKFYDEIVLIPDSVNMKIFKGPIPITLLIDPQGQIKYGHLGALDDKQASNIINSIKN